MSSPDLEAPCSVSLAHWGPPIVLLKHHELPGSMLFTAGLRVCAAGFGAGSLPRLHAVSGRGCVGPQLPAQHLTLGRLRRQWVSGCGAPASHQGWQCERQLHHSFSEELQKMPGPLYPSPQAW